VPAYLRSESEGGPGISYAPGYLPDLPGPVCEPVPENPLAGYGFLLVALDLPQIQDLQDAAYRREHLRRGLNFTGPRGLMFAQAPLQQFLEPGSDYVSREELMAALFPAMMTTAGRRGDVEPYVSEIARNEAARNFLEALRNPLVNVELVDPEGKDDAPSRLKFVVDFTEIADLHGAITLASLGAISPVSFNLLSAKSAVTARQLSEIALLQARLDMLNGDYLNALNKIIKEPENYAYRAVVSAMPYAIELNNRAAGLAAQLQPENLDCSPAVASLAQGATSLRDTALQAVKTVEELWQRTMPGDLTLGESLALNAENIREARRAARAEGGIWGNLKAGGNTIGLAASKVVRTFGSIFTGGYMDTNADRTSAYRRGDISYNSYSGFSVTDVLKGAVQDIAIFLPAYGGWLGKGAIGLFGVGEGTAAAYVLEGQAVGLVSGVAGAASRDFSSMIAAKLATSEDEEMYQRSQIGGWETWLEAGLEGYTFGSVMGAGTAMMPRPTSLQYEAARASAEPAKAAASIRAAKPARAMETSESPLTSPLVDEVAPVSTMEPPGPLKGPMARLKRAALYKLTSAAIEGSTPLNNTVRDFGSASLKLPEPARSVAADAYVGGRFMLSELEEGPTQRPWDPGIVQITTVAPDVLPATPAAPEVAPAAAVAPAARTPFEWSSQGVRPAAGMRVTTRTEHKKQEGARRWKLAVDQLVDALDLADVAGTEAEAPAVQTPIDIEIQTAIRDAIKEIKDSGIRSPTNAAYGTRLHAALARILRIRQLPADVAIEVEKPLSDFANLPDKLVRDWLNDEGQAYAWLLGALSPKLLDTNIRNLKIDAYLSTGDHSITFDLTSRESTRHLAKTMLYAALLAREGKISRVQEYYWVRWNWRGQ
jgi:hypothetical protein